MWKLAKLILSYKTAFKYNYTCFEEKNLFTLHKFVRIFGRMMNISDKLIQFKFL